MKKLIIAVMAMALTGCSGLSPLTGLVGSKPELTVQAGAENVKQTVGVTAKNDTSSKQETTVKDSTVKRLDTSNKKQVSTSTISAENITADKIEIQGKPDHTLPEVLFFISGLLIGYGFAGTRKKEA